MASDPQPDTPKVTVKRLYEVECDWCGVVSGERTKAGADVARGKHMSDHPERPAYGRWS